jgi:hypothetical protein
VREECRPPFLEQEMLVKRLFPVLVLAAVAVELLLW